MKRRGFSLTELLIATVIIVISMGAVALTLSGALRNHSISDAHSRAVNAARFTAAGINKRLGSDIARATAVEILTASSDVPDSAADDAVYLFLNRGSLKVRTSSGDETVPGSELVTDFRITTPVDPTSPDGEYRDRTLNISFTTEAESEDGEHDASYALSMDIPLLNISSRTGSSTASVNGVNSWTGKALKIQLGLSFDNLRLLDNTTGEKINAHANITKGTTVRVSYDIGPDVNERGDALSDDSTYEWYISSVSSHIFTVSDEEPTSERRNNGNSWQLVDSIGQPISGDTLNTSGKFFVKTSKGYAEWGEHGFIYCRVTPRLVTDDGSFELIGSAENSYFIAIAKSTRPNGGFWDQIRDAITKFQNIGAIKSDFPVNADAARTVIDPDTGETYVELKYRQGILGSTFMAKIKMEHLTEQIELSKEDGQSYTSPANFTVIVESRLEEKTAWGVDNTTWGYGLLLNGSCETVKKKGGLYRYNDTGYMLQYDKEANGFPIRLFAQGVHQNGLADHGIDYSVIKKLGPDNYTTTNVEGPYFEPAYMMTNEFKYNSNNYSGSKYRKWWLNENRRFAVTILEYHIPSEDTFEEGKVKVHPHFIIRGKYVDDYKEDENDPFCWGQEYFLSNPVWHGEFVGEAVTETKSGDKYTYTAPIYTHSPYNETEWSSGEQDKDDTYAKASNVYATRSPKNGEFNTSGDRYYDRYGITGSGKMDIVSDIDNTGFNSHAHETVMYEGDTATKVDKAKAKELMKNPKRDRMIGIRLWDGKRTGDLPTYAQIHDITLAPGFTKKELQAILPEGAKLYKLKEILKDDEYEDVRSNPNRYGFKNEGEVAYDYNQIFTGTNNSSDGKGNGSKIEGGVNGIQYQIKGTVNKWYGFISSGKLFTATDGD